MLLALLASVAWAADVVVHATTADAATAQVSAVTGLAPAELRPLELSAVLPTRPPMLVGPGRIDPCTASPSTNAQVREATAAAERHLAFLEYADASKQLDAATSLLGCLSEPVDAATAAHVAFLRGVALYASDEAAARLAFRQAHLFDRALAWDDRYAPDPQPLFEEALADLGADTPAILTVVPGPDQVPVLIDGARVSGPVGLAPGLHLVQVGHASVSTVRVDLTGDATLVIPGLVPADAVSWAGQPKRSGALAAVLTAVIGQGFVVWVVDGERTWKVTTGTARFESATPPEPVPVPAPDPVLPDVPSAPGYRPSWPVVVTGAGVFAAGGITAGLAARAGERERREAPFTTSEAEFRAAEKRHARYEVAFVLGNTFAGVGAAVVLGGFVVPALSSVQVGPQGVRVSGTFR